VKVRGSMLVLVGVAVAAAAAVWGQGRSAVDWTAQRAVVLESDDWGLAGFVPAADAWTGIDQGTLAPGRFPAVYWGSTLEDSAAVARLAQVLQSVRGRDGRPAVLQPNYVTGSLGWEGGEWVEYAIPEFPEAYPRPGLTAATAGAARAGVWHPEWHAAWHYDPALRRERAFATEAARLATERGILLFPGSEDARELGSWRPLGELAGELDEALARFTACFGRPPASVIAPDYTWSARNEALWWSRGLRVIQAKREQRNPDLPPGAPGRVVKFLGRRWDKLTHPDRTYLERNCRFEPVQDADPHAVTVRCRAEIRAAWAAGQPAVVETHRVNFAHSDPAVALRGTGELEQLLTDVAADGPVFLVDTEVAQLSRRGVSVRSVPGRVVVRNASGSRRVVAVGPTELAHAWPGGKRDATVLVMLPARASLDLVPAPAGWSLVPRP
jgi:hypothetical protein